MAPKPGDYFGFNIQGEKVPIPIQDTKPVLSEIKDALLDIKDLLTPHTKNNVINVIKLPVTQSATRLLSQNSGRKSLLIRNVGATSIYIGDQNVISTNGFKLLMNDVLTGTDFTGEVWAISDGPNGAASVIEG